MNVNIGTEAIPFLGTHKSKFLCSVADEGVFVFIQGAGGGGVQDLHIKDQAQAYNIHFVYNLFIGEALIFPDLL
jgi:hypothetical protein